MKLPQYILMIDNYLEEPNSINKDWVECLMFCRKLLKEEQENPKHLTLKEKMTKYKKQTGYDEYTPEDIDQSKPDYVEISLQHEDIKDEDIHDFMSERYYTMGEDDLEVPSKQIIIIDNEKFNNLDICNKDIIKPKLLSNGLICPIGLSNGPFSVYFSKNENDEIIAMKISLANNEHEEY
jgi:hypothetical protein